MMITMSILLQLVLFLVLLSFTVVEVSAQEAEEQRHHSEGQHIRTAAQQHAHLNNRRLNHTAKLPIHQHAGAFHNRHSTAGTRVESGLPGVSHRHSPRDGHTAATTSPENKAITTEAAASEIKPSKPLCKQNMHIYGNWQYNPEKTKSFPCCGRDEKDHLWNTQLCGPNTIDDGDHGEVFGDRGNGVYRKVGGHGCYCDKRESRTEANKREKFDWIPHYCDLAKFDAQRFCHLLDGRNITFIGDSTYSQTAVTLMNLVIAQQGNCTNQIRFGLNNALFNGEGCRDWYKIASDHQADIVVLGFGAWLHSMQEYEAVWSNFTLQYQAFQRSHPQATVVFKLQNPPHLNCQQMTDPLIVNPYGNLDPQYDKYQWNLLPIFDEQSKYRASKLGMKVLDMYPLYLRPDSHPSSKDCLHFCVPGPLDIIGTLLLTMLETQEIPAVVK